ncbi:MAG: sulfur carrier protein ThiS [Planctomycetes bacterium]|jgi:thiamine biosynthesis protein ThiS|nr:sulfur carrier protein ThiS [Planctomycetota bacterium]MCP4838035.1 sulfur carrier protein ThiS [Planctomycetota bacterium]
MKIDINGQPMHLDDSISIEQLLDRLDRSPGPCAVEQNGHLVPWKDRGSVQLSDGDAIEIVTLVGGG